MYNKLINLETYKKTTINTQESDFHIPAASPYTEDHLHINMEFFSPDKWPGYFSLEHLGFSYIGGKLRDVEELEPVEAFGDKQKYRLKSSKSRKNIRSSVTTVGKDLRQKGIFLAIDDDGNPHHLVDGNSFYAEAKSAKSPNFICLEFAMNDKWSESNDIAAGVYVNLYFKKREDATEDDIQFALEQIAKSKKIQKLIKKNAIAEVFKSLNQYYSFMLTGGIKVRESVKINEIITTIISKESGKTQALKTSQSLVLNDAKNKDLQDGEVYASDKTRTVTAWGDVAEKVGWHWSITRFNSEGKESGNMLSKSARIDTIIHMNGANLSDEHWWVKQAIKFLKDHRRELAYYKFMGADTKDSIIGFYQSVESLSHKWPLRRVVLVEEVETYYNQLVEEGKIVVT